MPPAASDSAWGDDIAVTGHHLEWLAIAPEQCHVPSGSWYALAFIEKQLRGVNTDELRLNYLSWSHAVRAWLIWSQFSVPAT